MPTEEEREECPKCRGQGSIIMSEANEFLQWGNCCRCSGNGWIELEPEDDE